jgi:hypothetical protein
MAAASVSHVRAIRPDTIRIAEVLARSHSRKQAANELGIPATTLERLCRDQALVALYEQMAGRGAAQRGGGKLRGDKGRATKLQPVRRWSIWWRVKPGESVCIWPNKEIDAVTQEEALDVFMTKVVDGIVVVKRVDLTVVEVCA